MKNSTPHWPRPDFLATGPRRPLLAWAWAATGALVLALAVADALDVQAAAKTLQTRLTRAEQRVVRGHAAAASATAPGPKADSRSDLEAVRTAQRTIDRLDHPWGQLLANLEAESPAGLQWLVFDHDADTPDLRVEGQAPDAATVLHLVDALAARRGWSEVVLSRLEAPDPHETTATGPLWRFELRAVINARELAAARDAAAG